MPVLAAPKVLSPDERRWLHDKFERLAAEESQLASLRTTYYAAIGTVLITGLVVAIADLLSQTRLLVSIATFLSLLGILISAVWIVLLHRTNDAKNMWREAACQLEREQSPLEGQWVAPITLRSNETLPLNLLQPFPGPRDEVLPRPPGVVDGPGESGLPHRDPAPDVPGAVDRRPRRLLELVPVPRLNPCADGPLPTRRRGACLGEGGSNCRAPNALQPPEAGALSRGWRSMRRGGSMSLRVSREVDLAFESLPRLTRPV